MDKQRLGAYVNLVEALLNSPPGQDRVLQAQEELIDARLVEVMWLYAEQVLQAQGQEQDAQCLIKLTCRWHRN